jgi:carbon storage regulator CsrA
MLVLSRKLGEKIVIQVEGHEPIEITIVRFGSNNVRLGISAERSMNIVRGELLEPSQPEGSPTV